jgi:hypothetical protein
MELDTELEVLRRIIKELRAQIAALVKLIHHLMNEVYELRNNQ